MLLSAAPLKLPAVILFIWGLHPTAGVGCATHLRYVPAVPQVPFYAQILPDLRRTCGERVPAVEPAVGPFLDPYLRRLTAGRYDPHPFTPAIPARMRSMHARIPMLCRAP